MKKTALSILIGLTFSTAGLADNLVNVYEQALANDPLVKQAKANRDSAFKGISVSRANLLPSVSASIAYSTATQDQNDFDTSTGALVINTFSTDSQNINGAVNFNLSLYDHSNWVNLRRAEKVAHQTDTQYASSVQDLIVRVVTAYLGVLRSQDNLEFVGAQKRAIERQLEQTKQRFEVGLTAITDVHEAQANFDNTVAQEILSENELEQALESLRVITGKYHAGLDILDTERFTVNPPQPLAVESWLETAQTKNLDLLASSLGMDIATDDIKATKAGLYPTLDLAARYNYSETDVQTPGSDLSLPGLNSESISVTLSVPIYAGNSIRNRTEQARFAYVNASEQRELTYRQTVQQVRSSHNSVRAAISRVRALKQAVVSANSALQATEAGFDVGTRTIVDVLNSTQNLYDAQRNLSGARYDFIQAMVDLKRASGELTKDDVNLINKGLMSPNS